MAGLLAAKGEAALDASPPSRTCRRPRLASCSMPRSRARSRDRCCSSPWPRPHCPQPAAALQLPAHISRTASPSTIAPGASTKIARSPSPSNATPKRAAALDDQRRQALEMRRAAVEVDVAAVRLVADHARRRSPSSRNSRGATVVVAPLAQSRPMRAPAQRAGDRAASAVQCSMYASTRFVRSTAAGASADRPRTRVGDQRLDCRARALRRTSGRGRKTP